MVKPELKQSRDCKTCGESFEVYLSEISDVSPRKYCSNKCRGIGRSLDSGTTITEHGGLIASDGYVRILVDGKREYEHRVVMERNLGRALHDGENVHHINGNRSDNRLENLELWASAQPRGQRVADLLEYAEQIIARYGNERSLI